MMLLLKKYKLTFLTLALMLIMGLTFWFAIRPLYNKIFVLRDEIQQELVRQENQEQQIQRLPELESQYNEVTAEEGYLDILLTEDKVVGFIRTLESVAQETHVEVKIQSNDAKFETQQNKKKSNAKKDNVEEEGDSEEAKKEVPKLLSDFLPFAEYLRLTLTVKGDYTTLATFVSRLESLPVALDIMGVEIRQPVRGDDMREGDVRAVNPFTSLESNTQNKDTKTESELPAEITEPMSPKLEMVIDLVVYVDKKKD